MMKTFFLFLISVLFLVSCTPVKNTASRQQQSNVEAVQTETFSGMQRTGGLTETTTEKESGEVVITTVREYDTDKPIDPDTGKPPLKKETEQTKRKKETEQTTKTEQQTTDSTEEKATAIQQKQLFSLSEKTAVERGLNWWQQILVGIGLLALLATLIWVGWKLFKRYFKPF